MTLSTLSSTSLVVAPVKLLAGFPAARPAPYARDPEQFAVERSEISYALRWLARR